jgi:2-polyprenyl-3-methyl-5-hydroxy-6-metoxy-1,4-benzoquinol methylase/GNAT superfamily N-acetyltransferase
MSASSPEPPGFGPLAALVAREPQDSESEVVYSWVVGRSMTPALLAECADLYSNHYGTWGQDAAPAMAGRRVRLSPAHLAKWFRHDDTRVALARDAGDRLLGYAIAAQTHRKGYGTVSWVTQFVVHGAFQNRGIGRTLLHTIWGFSNHAAWGVLTANPYAVRALEKATRRRCDPSRIRQNARRLMNVGREVVPYVDKGMHPEISGVRCQLNTHFPIDHSDVATRIARVAHQDVPWTLGDLDPGQEWFAFTFHDQAPFSWTRSELEEMLNASDRVVRMAYSRMPIPDGDQPWLRHAEREASLAWDTCGLRPGMSVLDLGCGAGRHSLALARRGAIVTGVDYVGGFVEAARAAAQRDALPARFIQEDARSLALDQSFDLAICLYDVVGSFASDAENDRILRTLHRQLKPGGHALISVMNLAVLEGRGATRFSLATEPDRLLALEPSSTMETSGDVFDPRYALIESDSRVVYRKEQFSSGTRLPQELIVRDRRYHKDEIEGLCRAAGFEVLWSRHVSLGKWEQESPADRGKEILLLCQRPSDS